MVCYKSAFRAYPYANVIGLLFIMLSHFKMAFGVTSLTPYPPQKYILVPLKTNTACFFIGHTQTQKRTQFIHLEMRVIPNTVEIVICENASRNTNCLKQV